MAETRANFEAGTDVVADPDRRKSWFAAGGMVGATLASSCCILPLVLVTLGISGAWIGNLTALEPYKVWFVGAAVIFVGFGFWQVYFRPTPVCADGSYCARPASSVITKSALWLATVLVALAMTIQWWAPLFY
ncbi:MAG: mercury transporter MerT [Alphaproteobacteria bacterium HGW-Alphaproteobacteria-5]|nr:MAG: mercury transporter MerT [Alphaproteobacteria bacterium HGW-Alphaproteobacteria-5]